MATPTWSDFQTIVAGQKVAVNVTVRGTFNLSTKFGALVYLRMGRLATTTPTAGAYALVRRYLFDGGNSRDVPHAQAVAKFQDSTTAAVTQTVSTVTAGPPTTLTVASTTSFSADGNVLITDSLASPTRGEFHRLSRNNSATVMTVDRPTVRAANSDSVSSQALVAPPIWVDGGPGTMLEVIFDNGQEGTLTYWVEALCQTLDSIS